MNTATNNRTNTTTLGLLVLVAVTLFSVGMSAQSHAAVSSILEQGVAVDEPMVAAAASSNSTLNIVSWFMGTKQTPATSNATGGYSNSKKQFINCGIAPNRLLIKSFLKKASNYATTVA